MTNCGITFQFPQPTLVSEDIGDQSHVLVSLEVSLARGNDASTLLTPVLQGVQTQVGHVCRFEMRFDPEDTTFLFQFVHKGDPSPSIAAVDASRTIIDRMIAKGQSRSCFPVESPGFSSLEKPRRFSIFARWASPNSCFTLSGSMV